MKKFIDLFKVNEFNYPIDVVKHGLVLSIFCYLGPLVLIPFFVERNNDFVKFHSLQGLNLLIWGIIIYFVFNFFPFDIVNRILLIIYTIYSLIGLINVCKGKAKELPLITRIQIFK